VVDMAVISFYHSIRINEWLGNIATILEAELFGLESLTTKLGKRHGRGAGRTLGLEADDLVRRLGEQLMPLLDRSNKMMLRNLAALRSIREKPAPSVNIGNAGQVNLSSEPQVNVAGGQVSEGSR